jgi:succinate dehydrogenase / fumarate reductase cytochrome b subunit
MASSAGPSPEISQPAVRHGVAPLRAGKGYSFVLRRLHSLTGIVPIGAFLLEHFFSNAFAQNGPAAYNDTVKFLTGLPFVTWIECLFIWLPILFHALYGFDYPWMGNWMYTAQRWTGGVTFVYIVFHTTTMRFLGDHLLTHPEHGFTKVWTEFQNPWIVAFYVIGIVAASWHFAYGLWLFAAKWGLAVGRNAHRKFGFVCLGIALLLIVVGLTTVRAFLTQAPPPGTVPSQTVLVR